MSAATETYKCKTCKQPFEARVADRNRGWARFCSKSCKAVKQERRTEQMAAHIHSKRVAHYAREYGGSPQFDNRGEYIGFTMNAAELAGGGYGDSGPHDPFHSGKD